MNNQNYCQLTKISLQKKKNKKIEIELATTSLIQCFNNNFSLLKLKTWKFTNSCKMDKERNIKFYYSHSRPT